MLCITFGVNSAVRKLTFQETFMKRKSTLATDISVKLISNNLPSGFTKKNVYFFLLYLPPFTRRK